MRLSTLAVLCVVFVAATAIQRITDRSEKQTLNENELFANDIQNIHNSRNDSFCNSNTAFLEGLELPVIREEDELILKRLGFTVSYNKTWKIPNWVAWTLTPERTMGKVKRADDFLPDPDLGESHRATDADYYRARYDRGHMAPAGDMKWDEQAMQESFYLSNICPQAPNLNRGDWRILEENCREWAAKGNTLYIVCGPIVEKGKQSKRIGKNKVMVPDHFFKVILWVGSEPQAIGFIFPNDDCDKVLFDYAVSVDKVETVTGMDFFHALPDDLEEQVEEMETCKFESKR